MVTKLAVKLSSNLFLFMNDISSTMAMLTLLQLSTISCESCLFDGTLPRSNVLAPQTAKIAKAATRNKLFRVRNSYFSIYFWLFGKDKEHVNIEDEY